MIKIINEDSVVVFDEIGWGDTEFQPLDTAKFLVENYFNDITLIEFLSADNVISIKLNITPDNIGKIAPFYWFRNISEDLLNFLCQTPNFRSAVKRFFIRSGYLAFPVQKYPLLAATLLGNNNEY